MSQHGKPTGGTLAGSLRALLAVVLAAGCGAPPSAPPPAAETKSGARRVVLVDATAGSGVEPVHQNGASAGRLLPETMGSGVAVFAADGHGLADLLFADGAQLGGRPPAPHGLRCYRNAGALRFVPMAEGGLQMAGYAMGFAIGDVDGDGALDVYATGVPGDRLFLGDGGGRFRDATAEWGLEPLAERWSFGSSAAFFDADGDGDLDLYAGRYVEWSPATDRACSPDGEHRVYCTPEIYPAVPARFWRNHGRRFQDETTAAGLSPPGKALGVVVLDYGRDGALDLAVANDTEPNFLFVGRGDGTFVESALAHGLALGPSGVARGGMGIAAGDLDGDGREDVAIGNFANEMAALFRALPDGQFADVAASMRIGFPTLLQLAFGTVIADLDGDGLLDVAFANGHIEPTIAAVSGGRESFEQPLQVFRNTGDGFADSAVLPGRPLVGRGLAAGDLDRDGDLDLVVSQNGAAPVLLRNDSPPRPWLRLRLRGRGGNTWGQGAELVFSWPDGATMVRRLEPSGSYLSSSEPIATIGLGDRGAPSRLTVRWPGGGEEVVSPVAAGRELEVRQSDPR